MTTNPTVISMGASESSTPKRSRTHHKMMIGAATAVAATAVSALFIGLDATTASPGVRTPGAQKTQVIFGPAHPLGAPDIGIPCASRVFTRC